MPLGFYFDQTRCIGCFTCCVSCKDWHDIPAGSAHWRRVVSIEDGEFPHPFLAYLSTACYHCEDPLCAVVCPAEAIIRREDGIVLVDKEKCREDARCGITVTNGTSQANVSACEVTCPAHVDVPGYIALISNGRFKEALNLMREKLPLLGILGRVCHRPCENECKRSEVDKPLAIRDLKRFAYDAVVDEKVVPLPKTKEQGVAVIGSGPAGLSAAYDLLRKGYKVTIFEALPVTGGMMAVGIPSYRLPREVLRRDIEYLKGLGLEIRTNTPIGKEMTLGDLSHQGYGAIFIAVGAHKGRKLPIPGAEADNVSVGTSFLHSVNLGEKIKVGKRVLVLGGGGMAFDCARVALRFGAKKVTIFYRRTRNEMPASSEGIDAALEEGVEIIYLVAPSRVTHHGGVLRLECLRMKLGEPDASGRARPVPIEGSEFITSADMIVLAVGRSPDLKPLLAGTDIKTTKHGTIAVDPETLQTSLPGVFAGGDAVTGTRWVIDAIAGGQRAAHYIDCYLKGEVLGKSYPDIPVIASDIKVDIPADLTKEPRQEIHTLAVEQRAHNFGEVELGYDEKQAITEAKRCMSCAGRLCLRVCPYDAPQFGAEQGAKMEKCDFCVERLDEGKNPVCVDACITRALDWGSMEELKAKYGDIQAAVGFAYSPSAKPSTIFKPKHPPDKTVEWEEK